MKKNRIYYPSRMGKKVFVIFITMKLLTLLIFTGSMAMAANTYSQEARIDLKVEDAPLAEIFNTIEKNSEFIFVYNANVVNSRVKRSISVKDENIEKVLDLLFRGIDVVYRIDDRQVFLYKKKDLKKMQPLETEIEMKGDQPQQKEIAGIVTDSEGQPLPGVSVVVKGTVIGTVTNNDGEFSLSIPINAETLQFSFVGMRSQEVVVGNQTTINVQMVVDAIGLEEVVAIGYGVQSRKSVTSSVSSVNVEDALKGPTSSVAQNLSGRAAGLTAKISSAQPGGAVNLQIRGAATGRAPLIVIDGMPTSDFNARTAGRYSVGQFDSNLSFLNPNDIESIDILKDASATSIYGSKAAGGVILITTKRGKKVDGASFSVELDASAGIQNYYGVPEVLGPVKFMEENNRVYYEQWLFESRNDVYSTVPKPSNWSPPGSFNPIYSESQIDEFQSGQKTGTDWINEVTRTGIVQNYNLSLSGSEKNTRFFSTLNAYQQRGIIKNNDLAKYSGSFNIDQKLGEKLDVGFNIRFTQQETNNIPIGDGKRFQQSGVLMAALVFDPTLPVYDEKGGYQVNTRQSNVPNPVSHFSIENMTDLERFFSTAFLKYNVTSNLFLKGQVGFDRNQSDNYGYIPTAHIEGSGTDGRADRNNNKNTNYQTQFLINYINTIDEKHNISSTLGTEYMKYKYEGFSAQSTNFPYDGMLWNNLSLGANRPVIGSFGGSSELISYFLRVSYDYDFKYFITANFRIDGSSNFAPENQYAFFPGFSIGWDMAREPFMASLSGWLNNFKIRAGYGITGNDNIGSAFTDWYAPGANTVWGTNIVSGVRLAGLGNKNLTWEKQEDINFGIDFSLLKGGKISGAIDVFNREISQLLGRISLPSWNPISGINSNLDAMKQTYGAELTLNSKNIQTPTFSWNSTITFTYYRDRWLKRDPSYTLKIYEKEKQYFEELWYYKSDGLNPVGSTDPLNPIPGQIKILDVNSYLLDEDGNQVVDENGKPQYAGFSDEKFNDADLQLIGINQPYTVGFNNTFNYKQFDLSIFTYGVFNAWKLNGWKARSKILMEAMVGIAENTGIHVIDRWNSDNLTGTFPSSISGAGYAPGGNGDYFLEEAWFIRIRDINLGYTFPTGKLKRLRVYCNIVNPFIFTPYTGIDPETENYDASYPNQRTYTFGLNINF